MNVCFAEEPAPGANNSKQLLRRNRSGAPNDDFLSDPLKRYFRSIFNSIFNTSQNFELQGLFTWNDIILLSCLAFFPSSQLQHFVEPHLLCRHLSERNVLCKHAPMIAKNKSLCLLGACQPHSCVK